MFAVHDGAARPSSFQARDGFGLMRKRLVAWTLLTCALLALTVWTLLGPPDHRSGTHLPSRTAAVR